VLFGCTSSAQHNSHPNTTTFLSSTAMYHTNYSYPLLANWKLILNKTCSTSLHTAQHKLLRKLGKRTNNILGDWNSVGDKTCRNIVGSYGLGRRNNRGQMLIDFCERNRLIVTNMWFKKPKRRLYTWKAPGDWSLHIRLHPCINSETV
jgi:hypothetical protein